MGRHDSSKTRVQPVFSELLKKDASGENWLGILLGLASAKSPTAKSLSMSIGKLASAPGEVFEVKVPPPERFLKWLLENPQQLSWPLEKGKPKRFGDITQVLREKLVGKHGKAAQNEAQSEGLIQLKTLGAANSLRKWWAFEGFTTVDCRLETENALIFIEGKRKDILSPSTEWFEGRNQLFRNLETCNETAEGKPFGVLLIAETDHFLNFSKQMIERGLPHFQDSERSTLVSHFLGVVSWGDFCGATGIDFRKLPDSVPDSSKDG